MNQTGFWAAPSVPELLAKKFREARLEGWLLLFCLVIYLLSVAPMATSQLWSSSAFSRADPCMGWMGGLKGPQRPARRHSAKRGVLASFEKVMDHPDPLTPERVSPNVASTPQLCPAEMLSPPCILQSRDGSAWICEARMSDFYDTMLLL